MRKNKKSAWLTSLLFKVRSLLGKVRVLSIKTQAFLKSITNRFDMVVTLKMKNEDIKTAVINISYFEKKFRPLLIMKLEKLKKSSLVVELPVFESGADEAINFGDVKYIVIQGDITEAYINQSIVGTDTNFGY